jgi:phosphatidylserine decarboxylase
LNFITKDGLGIVVISWLTFFAFFILFLIFNQPILLVMTILTAIFSVFNLGFFRDPERQISEDPNVIVSPADGKVITITKVKEEDFFRAEVSRISIFLSVFNVHVNRSPISGNVEHFSYKTGAFLAAFKENASLENEQTVIGIVDDKNRKVMFTQIAGAVARRIICHLREGFKTKKGERMGMIRYGSRVDIYFLDKEVDIKVKLNQKVKAGESILGVFK